MKVVLLTTVLLCSACLVSYAQTLTLRLKDVTVKSAMEQIKKTSGYSFVYATGDIDTQKKVSIEASDASLDNVINQILKGQNVSWQISGQNIVVKKAATPTTGTNANTSDRPMTYSGKVVDMQGQPVIGAAVFIRGTKTQTMTDGNGSFSLTAAPGSSLTVSFLGYLPFERMLSETNPTLDITLAEDALSISEVVVVGYGTQKRVNLTGAVSTVDKEYLQTRPVNNTVQALQGVVPGLNISATVQDGGSLKGNMTINIRGAGTIGQGSNSSPLVLVDGVPGDLSLLNPDDISNISVLKDAASSAIYGSRAAFGVVLVTTKRGHSGKVNVTYSNNFRFATPIRTPDFADSYTFALFMNEGQRNAGLTDWINAETMEKIQQFQRGEISASNIPNKNDPNKWASAPDAYANTNWVDELIKKWAFSQEHNLAVSGGTDKTQYYISLNYLDRDGLLTYGSEKASRYTFNTRVDTRLAKWITVGSSINYVRQDIDEPLLIGDSRFGGPGAYLGGVYKLFPTIPHINPDGSYHQGSMTDRLLDAGRAKEQRDVLIMQLNTKITPIEGWNIVAEGNYKINNTFGRGTVEPVYEKMVDGTLVPISINGSAAFPAGYSEANERAYRDNFFSANLYTDYSKLFDNGHYFKVMLGFNTELDQSRNFAGYRTDLISLETPSINTASGTDLFTDGAYNHWSTVGFFGRANYNYKERYIAEVVLRYDGSSRFKQELRWNWYPSFSIGWNIAKEGFMERVSDQVNMLKIRASYGTLGNQNTANLYPYYQTVPFSAATGTWLVNGAKPNTAGMPNLISNYLTWERVESIDVGLDFAFLRNRLSGSVGWFQRSTLDMVGPAPQLPNTLGTTVPPMNNADLQTQGWELELAWNDHVGDFRYGIRATLSDYKTKVLRYPNITNSIGNPIAGEYLGNIWGYQTIGIAKTKEEMAAHLASLPNGGQSALPNGTRWDAGDIMYADINNDGKIDGGKGVLGDTGDQKILGNDTPRWAYGVTLDFAWKGIDLMVFGQGVGQRDIWIGPSGNAGAMFWGAAQGIWQASVLKTNQDYFRPAGTDNPMGENLGAYFPRPIFGGNGNKNMQTQSGYMQNGAYFRLKTVQLGYTFPREWTVKAAIQKLRLYVSGENLWTITSLPTQFDPETFTGSANAGVGRSYPLQATVSFGVSITF